MEPGNPAPLRGQRRAAPAPSPSGRAAILCGRRPPAPCTLLLKAPPGPRRAAPVINKGLALAPLLGRRRRGQGAPPAQRQCGERNGRGQEPDGHGGGAHAALFTRPLPAASFARSPHGPCRKTRNEEQRLGRPRVAAAPRGARRPGRSAVGLLHGCQQSNTRKETSAQPDTPTVPPPTTGHTHPVPPC